MPVRAMEPNDIPEVLRLGYQMHQESVYRRFDYNEDKFARLVCHYMMNPDKCFTCVSVVNGVVNGVLLGSIDEHYFGHDRVASDTLWYVTPKSRGSRAGLQLLRQFEQWSKDRNAAEIYMGVSTGVNSDKTGGVLQKLGYDVVGGNYKLRVVV